MSDTADASVIAGHDCNAYCRPGEGLHCEVAHCFRPKDFPVEQGRRNKRLNQQFHGPNLWPVIRREPAEVPPLPPEKWEAYFWSQCPSEPWAQEQFAEAIFELRRGNVAYVGAELVWFRVPKEADRA